MIDATDDFRILLENYLAFVASHRGVISKTQGNIIVKSEAPGFSTIFATGTPLSREAIGDRSVRNVPWNNAWASALPALGLTRSAEMIFMVHDPRTPSPKDAPRTIYALRHIQTADGMIAFAETQAQAFLGLNDPQFLWWRAFMRRAALTNLENPQQRFLLAYLGAEPVGTLLIVDTDAVAGFYAVATLPEYRRRGVCTALMHAAESDPVSRRHNRVTLQVMAGSVAETVYRRFGYREVFRTPIYAAEPLPA